MIARGFHITFQTPKSEGLSLFAHGERAYDHVFLVPGKAKGLGPELTAHKLLEFASKDGNILLGLSATQPTPSNLVSLFLELDIHLPPDRNALVVDHFNYDAASAAEKHDVLLVSPPKNIRPDVKNFFDVTGPIAVPRAVGQILGNGSPLLAPILRAPSTAYSYNPKEEADSIEDLFATGEQLSLITAMQGRNSARFTVVGSSEMLENTWFNAKVKGNNKDTKTANREFAKRLSGWTFKELGVLKVGKLIHYLNEGAAKNKFNASMLSVPDHSPGLYRIKNDVVSKVIYQLSTNP
jgi:oligosaccharyltransferase complex subunit beta